MNVQVVGDGGVDLNHHVTFNPTNQVYSVDEVAISGDPIKVVDTACADTVAEFFALTASDQGEFCSANTLPRLMTLAKMRNAGY